MKGLSTVKLRVRFVVVGIAKKKMLRNPNLRSSADELAARIDMVDGAFVQVFLRNHDFDHLLHDVGPQIS